MVETSPAIQRLVRDVTEAVTRFAGEVPDGHDLVSALGGVLVERMASLLVSQAALANAPPEVFVRGVREIAEVFQAACLARAAATNPDLLTDPLFGTRPAGRA